MYIHSFAAMRFLSILLAHFLELLIIGKNSYYFVVHFLISGCCMKFPILCMGYLLDVYQMGMSHRSSKPIPW